MEKINEEVGKIMEEYNFREIDWNIAFSEEFVHIVISNIMMVEKKCPPLNTELFRKLDWVFKNNGSVEYEADNWVITYEDYIYGNVLL